jgi:DNA-binding response OmpR family regulator
LEPVALQSDFDTSRLTAKEALLFEYLRSHPGQVCTKDELVQAVWPEDQIYEQGVRDDSLAQLVRRTRIKIEPDPSTPLYLHTIPGRGYKFTPRSDL